jgi:hypothetical protein
MISMIVIWNNTEMLRENGHDGRLPLDLKWIQLGSFTLEELT